MYSDILILAMLRKGPQHGYEIKKSIEYVNGGMLTMNNKVLYPALKRFEEMGAVEREVVRQEGKPDRHVYHLTERGTEILQAYLREFTPQQAANDAEFFTRASFFEYLEPEERIEILETRLAHIQDRLNLVNRLHSMAGPRGASPHAERVLAFQTQSIQNEYQWLVAWIEELRAKK